MRLPGLVIVVLCFLLCFTCRAQLPAAPIPPAQALQRVQAGVAALQRRYVQRTGLYETTGWWNAANAITVLVDAMRASGSKPYLPVLANTFTQAQIVIPKAQQVGPLLGMTGAVGFLNDYYDDEGWWALAWIDAYDLTGEARYLSMAQSIFADMAGGWDPTCGGGIWWSKDRTYKNAIANELFFSVAAHLASRERNASEQTKYADWSSKEWAWFKQSGMINDGNLVNDGLMIDKTTGACRNNGKTVWTYNQGVLIGALAERSRALHDPELLAEANRIADASLTHLTDSSGVLHDGCEPNCGGDGVQFKGIFVRNLRALNDITHNPRYAEFFRTNADAIWTDDRGPGDVFGTVWSGPFTAANAGAQVSALDALVAAVDRVSASVPRERSTQGPGAHEAAR